MIHILTASFDEALHHANHLRTQMPAEYNAKRVNEKPIPPVRYTHMQSTENTDVQSEVKPEPFEQVQLDAADVSALDDIFSDDIQ